MVGAGRIDGTMDRTPDRVPWLSVIAPVRHLRLEGKWVQCAVSGPFPQVGPASDNRALVRSHLDGAGCES